MVVWKQPSHPTVRKPRDKLVVRDQVDRVEQGGDAIVGPRSEAS